MSEQVASAAVVTDAKDQKAVDFYKRYGFIELPKTELKCPRLLYQCLQLQGCFTNELMEEPFTATVKTRK